MEELSEHTTMVVGGSRGLGRGIAEAFAAAGKRVVVLARTRPEFGEMAGARLQIEVGDAGDASLAGRLLDQYEPQTVILVAGASPLSRRLQDHTWETFSVNWNSDVQIAFHWVREALLKPLRPGSKVIVISSGAALAGSPLSGGYAGAKATQRFMTSYAREESERGGLGVTFTAVLPRLTPLTDLGRAAVRAYAARAGLPEQQYLQEQGEPLSPEGAGTALLQLAGTAPGEISAGYLLTSGGLQPLP
jgi:NAD(P)-dependent dehydrogenase (short-subunit alcohol dehydrogenase family)